MTSTLHVPLRERATKSLVYVTRMKLGSTRHLMPVLPLWRWTYRDLIAGPRFGVCIDGFPRCANTYATTVFSHRNPDVRVAHHMHVAGQVLRAVHLGVPCAVLIREPLASISSMLAVDQRLPVRLALWSYIDFYLRLEPVRREVAVCEFSEVVDDASVVARRLNSLHGLAFDARPVAETERVEIMQGLDDYKRANPGLSPWTAIPDPSLAMRERRALVTEQLLASPRLDDARAVYDRWIGDLQPPASCRQRAEPARLPR